MRGKEMLEAVGYIDGDLIKRGEMRNLRAQWKRWTAIAASICLLVGGALIYHGSMPQYATEILSVSDTDIGIRMWFNDANTSTWYFIPGLIVLVITISGVFLTSMVMAKEWERGTLEALFVTPVKVLEILLSKMIPYFCVAMVGFSLCVAASQLLFDVPMHGSFIIILLCTMLYLFVALGVGLMISSITKNQFLASQMALVLSMMPTMMLSGFLFDLRSVPLVVKMVGYALPPTYYMQLLKTLFLAGNNWLSIFKNCTILVLYAIFFISMAFRVTQKRVE
ncbi:MAG: ABC transporter permease [Phascolarctobacterium sp.]|nr:ABC transporter permease [Phascolarctobacterium sp.]